MNSETIWRHIDTERLNLAHVLESLPQAAWDEPSLCEGWRVRDVGAHLALSHMRLRDMVRPAIRSGFRYNAMTRYAAVHSPLTHEQIVATLRSFVGSRRRVPFATELEPLLDILVHTQDICVPLGIEHPMPVDAAVAAANRVVSIRGPIRLWEQPHGRLVATDAAWAYGIGPVREASMQVHLLTLTGRQPSSGSRTAAP